MKSSRSSEKRKENREAELLIEKLAYGGYGFGRHKGKVFLVRYGAPGDLVRARVIRDRKDYAEAVTSQVVVPSEIREKPRCRHFGVCGGCQLQHIAYEKELEYKAEVLRESLHRIGKLRDLPDVELVPSPEPYNYRVRVQFKAEKGKVGFFRWGERELVDIQECPVLHPRVSELIPDLKQVSELISVPTDLHLFYSPSRDAFLLSIVNPSPPDREMLEDIRKILPPEVVGVGSFKELRGVLTRLSWSGEEHTFVEAGGWRYRVSFDSFFQANYMLWEAFIDRVIGGVSFRKALELHCGVGFFSIPLSFKGNFLEASDSSRSAVADAQYNAKLNGAENVVFLNMKAYRHLKSRSGEVLDLLVVDPPRSGLGEGELDLITKNRPDRIVYISCNPTTLSRDLSRLVRSKYRVSKLAIIDMFPRTYHTESIAVLEAYE